MVEGFWAPCRRAFALIFLSALFSAASADDCELAESAIKKASEIRMLDVKRPVPCLIHGKEEIKSYLLNVIENELPPRRLELEGVAGRATGFLPDDFDYKQGLVDLYISQLGGYYDPKKQHYVMAGWMPSMLQTTIAVHELTHALQDQHFGLAKIIDPKIENSDQQLARSALVEGDATAVMIDFSRGGRVIENEDSVDGVMMQNLIGSSLTAAMSSAPPSLQLMLLFPYTSGLRFAHALLKKDSYPAIDDAFRRLPRSTEEILHPEKYEKSEPDFEVIPEVEVRVEGLAPEAKPVFRDTLGEFAISAMLSRMLKDKSGIAEASAGWGGDRLVVYELAGEKQRHVVWRIRWDTPKDLGEFEKAYRRALSEAYPAAKLESPGWVRLNSGKEVRFERSGPQVLTLAFRVDV